MCKVSVITITYNAEKVIKNTMHSVLKQNYKDFEYIIKDGQSTDHTSDIIRKMIKCDSDKHTIKYISSSDSGIYDAMNEAVHYASGEWIIFMNAGDLFYDENVLRDVFSAQYANNTGVLYGHALMVLAHNRGFVVTFNLDILYNGGSICHQAIFEKREYLIQYPFDTNLSILADRAHCLDLLSQNVMFQRTNTIIVKEDRNGISSTNYPQFYKEEKELFKKYKMNCRHKNIQIGKLKMIVKRLMPQIEEYVMIIKNLKRIS